MYLAVEESKRRERLSAASTGSSGSTQHNKIQKRGGMETKERGDAAPILSWQERYGGGGGHFQGRCLVQTKARAPAARGKSMRQARVDPKGKQLASGRIVDA